MTDAPLPPTVDELRWQKELTDAQHNQLGDVRATAQRWQSGIAALIGAFSVVSVIVAPSKLGDLTNEYVKWGVLVLAVAAGLAGIGAYWKANTAANGWPRIDAALDANSYETEVTVRSAATIRALRSSRVLTIIAICAVVLAAIASQFDGLLAKPDASIYVLVNGAKTVKCGALTSDSSHRALVNGARLSPNAKLTIVPHC